MALADCPPPVRGYFEAINADRFDDLREVMAPDVVLHPCGMDPVHGVDDAVKHYAWLLEKFPDHVDDPDRVLPSGDSVTVEIDFRGRTDGGREVTFHAVDVFDLADGRIVRVKMWYDTLGVRRQIVG